MHKTAIAFVVAAVMTLGMYTIVPLSAYYLNEKIAVAIGSWTFSAGFGFGTSYEFGQQAAPVLLFAFCFAWGFIAATGTKA